MVEVSYHCPYCGAVTSIDRAPVLRDGAVTRQPDPDRDYAATTDDVEAADGIEFVCLGDADQDRDGGYRDTNDPGPVGLEPDSTETVTRDGRRPTGPIPGKDGCGRTFYLEYYRSTYPDGRT